MLPLFLVLLLLALLRYGYGWVMLVRGWLYDVGWLASEAFPVPVIALGNLRVGGTGKSPHAAYLVEVLLGAGYRVGLLSRGYGRQSRGFRLVTPADVATLVGDEPLEQARRFAAAIERQELTVAVAEDRRTGIRQLLAQARPPGVVVLDDAYQHRAVRPSLRVLLTEFHRPFPADRILPLGRLREFAGAARRAHAVVVTKCPPHETRPDLVRGLNLRTLRAAAGEEKPVFFTTYAYGRWQPLSTPLPGATLPPPPHDGELVVLTAVDNPAPLYDYLLAQGFRLTHKLRFPDHHLFTEADLEAVRQASGPLRLPVLTTGKDATRLLNEAGQPRAAVADLPVWWVPVLVAEVPVSETISPATLRELVLGQVRGFKSIGL